MADCNNTGGTEGQKVSGAFPNRNIPGGLSGLQITEVTNQVFDMNSLLSAAKNYNALNNAVNQLIGMEVRWFRAVPQLRSQDVLFQEYTLSNVEDTPLCLKVVLPDGNFPDSKYNYDLMGLEYEVPLEIHIDKTYWGEIAGTNTAPQKKDIVYFAIPNKLYEVISCYLLRGFMEQETTWKINLKKYQPQASRREGDVLTQTIDDYTVSAEEIFGDKMDSDIQKLEDNKQMSPFNSTDQDIYKTLDASLSIIPSRLEIYGVVVAESFYDLSSSNYFDAVTYTGMDQISTTDDRCITAWTMIDPGPEDEYEVTSLEASTNLPYPANYRLTIESRVNIFEPDSNIEISRPGSLNFYAKLISTDLSTNTHFIEIDQPVIDHLASIKSNWTAAKGYKMKFQDPASILDGMNTETVKGFKVDIYSNQYIKIHYGTQEHVGIMSSRLLNNEWYGVVVNIGNTWGQYNTVVYKQHPTDTTTKLETVFNDTLNFTPEATDVSCYTINKSPSYLTNLRLYVSTMEEEKQMNELLRYFVPDGDQLIIGDNADSKFLAPYISQQK